jgi:LytS/YehU family sensor histidine kinase
MTQLFALTMVSRWLERRGVGVVSTALVGLLVATTVATAFQFLTASLLGMLAAGPWLRVVKGAVAGFEVYGLWMLAFRYPGLVYDAQVRSLEVERARQAAELAQLREHLQPHFLRNTLNAIATMVVEDLSEARSLVAALADLLSASIEDSAPERTLGAEIGSLRRYAEILEARYRGTLRFAWDEGPMTAATMIPRLLLQPLVENAVHHGALARATGGLVTVRRARTEGGTVIEIEDNGPGFNPDAPTSDGLGLRLVRRRVEIESRGSFRVNCTPQGTRAIVELP